LYVLSNDSQRYINYDFNKEAELKNKNKNKKTQKERQKMDKFEDIKVGDVVIVEEYFTPGIWEKRIPFFIAKTVEKVTPKRFVVGDSLYRKSDGMRAKQGNIRLGHKVYNEGERINDGCLALDQSKERHECMRMVTIANKYGSKLLAIKEGLNYKTPNLKDIATKIDEIELLMKT